MPFVCALGLVYFAEYFINQGLVSSLYLSTVSTLFISDLFEVVVRILWEFDVKYNLEIKLLLSQMELLYFRNFFLTHSEQYRWLVICIKISIYPFSATEPF